MMIIKKIDPKLKTSVGFQIFVQTLSSFKSSSMSPDLSQDISILESVLLELKD